MIPLPWTLYPRSSRSASTSSRSQLPWTATMLSVILLDQGQHLLGRAPVAVLRDIAGYDDKVGRAYQAGGCGEIFHIAMDVAYGK